MATWQDAKADILPQWDEILDMLIGQAQEYWERAKCPDDFCVQEVSMGYIIFGGTNRVVWRINTGFRIDRSYCSANFLAANEGQ